MGRRRLVFDAVAGALYLLCANPAITGISAHEWLGLGVVAVLLAHVGGARASGVVAKRGAANAACDVALFVTLAVCTVSGIMVSGAVLPAWGLVASGYYYWDPLHLLSAKVLVALLIVHIALHGKAIMAFVGSREKRSCDNDG